jgi:hypothetical protein
MSSLGFTSILNTYLMGSTLFEKGIFHNSRAVAYSDEKGDLGIIKICLRFSNYTASKSERCNAISLSHELC